MVGLTRVELVTSSLSGTRSNQLSYTPGNWSQVSSLKSQVRNRLAFGACDLRRRGAPCDLRRRRGAAVGGGSRTRTGDIRLAKPTLYQLSYAPDSAREAGSGSVSVRGEEKFGFSFWEAGEQARSAMCRRVDCMPPNYGRPQHATN